tara:strand:- start:1060 stop:1773 length:714 start_codon:yes stop_codon:yes gene_type:complete
MAIGDTTELGVDNIQYQAENCDSIVNNIDLIVSKLYKIRQQALAQREYIIDATRLLVSKTKFAADTKKLNYVIGAANIDVFNGTTAKPKKDEAFVKSGDGVTPAAIAFQQNAIQSLFAFKHDCGTSTHFTTDQIGVSDNRIKGLSLADVLSITTGLNDFLKLSDVAATALTDNMKKIFLKIGDANIGSVTPNGDAALIANEASLTSYKLSTTDPNGKDSLYVSAATSDLIIGFGLAN